MFWNDIKSVLTCGGKDYKKGDKIPDSVLASMGKKRVKALEESKQLAGKVTPEKDEVDAEEKQRLDLLNQAKMLGLKPNHNTGAEKLSIMIEDEQKRLELLTKAKGLKLDVADDATAEEIEKAIAAANGPN